MKKLKYLSSFCIAFVFGVFVMSNFGNLNISISITNIQKEKETYFEDENGDLWTSKDEYLEYQDNNYYKAPDGTIWQNQYRYEQSLK